MPKPIVWLGDTLARLRTYPQDVQDEMGYALYLAQIGEKYIGAKPFKELGTVRFAERVYVLHVFQKKSKKGIATPQSTIDLVRQRLKRTVELHQKREH